VILRIDTDDWWSSSLKDRLEAQRDTLLQNEYMEALIESEPFRSIADELINFIRKHRILAYHCTKEPQPHFFAASGLRILDRGKHQADFLDRYQSLFTPTELNQIQSDWAEYFTGEQDGGRNGRLWFCLAPDQVADSGTESFFTYFGGEAIYMPLIHRPALATKLSAIGSPVVVETSIDPNELEAFSEVSLAINTMSLFHRRANPRACIHGSEGYVSCNVTPSEIVRVTPRELFLQSWKSNSLNGA